MTKTLQLGREFATKNDACEYITGKPMTNNFNMQEVSDKYNIIFLQNGQASYKRKGVTVVTGHNRIFKDRVESHRLNAKEKFPLDVNKPVLIFVKTLHRGNQALAYYRYHGKFKIESISSLTTGNMDYIVYAKVADEITI